MQKHRLIPSVLVALAFVSSATATTAKAISSTPPESDKVAAQALIQAAKDIKRTSYKKEESEKRRILAEASAAYGLVLKEHPDQSAECAEASFRIGEIHRTLRETTPAKAAFQRTVTYGNTSPKFAARAVLELGHLARRAGEPAEAIARYEQVTTDFLPQSSEAAQAITWRGKMESQRGNGAKARKIWLELPDRVPSEPVRAVRAADLAALSALKEGMVEEGRAIVERTRARFSAENPDQEWWSPEVDQALARMKSALALDPGER